MPSSPTDLFRLVFDLCRFRREPQDVPYSVNLLAALVAASVALDALVGGLLGDAQAALADSALSAAVVLALCAIALSIRGLGPRYVQTASALFACGLLFSLVQGIVAWLAGSPPASPATPSGVQLILYFVMLALFVWGIGVYAHIMRHAMNAPFGLAVALVISWVIAYWALARVLLPAAT
ncbi:MAG: hypothetical protein ABI843_16710 [Dokdonella sp.]